VRAKRTDDNQKKLVSQIRQLGWSVKHTHMVGQGLGDVIIGAMGRNYLIEIKDPGKPKSARKLSPAEVKFHEHWQGQIDIAETIEDVIKIVTGKPLK